MLSSILGGPHQPRKKKISGREGAKFDDRLDLGLADAQSTADDPQIFVIDSDKEIVALGFPRCDLRLSL
jgi:hypothetical protein